MCVSHCPVLYQYAVVSETTDGQGIVSQRRECVRACPSAHYTLVADLTTVDEASGAEVPFRAYAKCVDSCAELGLLREAAEAQFQCVKQCRSGGYDASGTCVASCAHMVDGRCVSGPKIPIPDDPRALRFACAQNRTFADLSEQKCVRRCPGPQFLGACTSKCPSEAPYVEKRGDSLECVASCRGGVHVRKNSWAECAEGCGGGFVFRNDSADPFQAECVGKCDSALGLFISGQNDACERECLSGAVLGDKNTHELTCLNGERAENACLAFSRRDAPNAQNAPKELPGPDFCAPDETGDCGDPKTPFLYEPGRVCAETCGDLHIELNGTCRAQCRSGAFAANSGACLRGWEDCVTRAFTQSGAEWACTGQDAPCPHFLQSDGFMLCFEAGCPAGWAAAPQKSELFKSDAFECVRAAEFPAGGGVSAGECPRVRRESASSTAVCVPFCSVSEYVLEENGVFVCTADARGFLAIESTGELVTECGLGYRNETHCLASCARFYVREGLKYCVERCPDGYKYAQSLRTDQIECVAVCEAVYDERSAECVQNADLCQFVARDAAGKLHCLETCPERKVPTTMPGQMECVAFCPANAPFSRDGVCTEVCPWLVDVEKLECVTSQECLRAGKFTLGANCVSACPAGYALDIQRECVISECRFRLLTGAESQLECFSQACPGALSLESDGSCVTACSSGGDDFVVVDGRCQYTDARAMKATSLRLWGISGTIVSVLLLAAFFGLLCISKRLRANLRQR